LTHRLALGRKIAAIGNSFLPLHHSALRPR
jgi:hypothetical protein